MSGFLVLMTPREIERRMDDPDLLPAMRAIIVFAEKKSEERNVERDRAIYHGLCERIGEMARFTGRVDLMTDPDLKRRALELARDFTANYQALLVAAIERLPERPVLLSNGENNSPQTQEENHARD